jgi:hypothetical protein
VSCLEKIVSARLGARFLNRNLFKKMTHSRAPPWWSGALLCSCWLFALHCSAFDSLQECSWLFEELKVALLPQDRRWDGTFTYILLSSEIEDCYCSFHTIVNNMTMKDYFSMLKSSVMLQCPACLLIRVQPNTYIEKNEHFWTASHLVKERGWLKQATKVTIHSLPHVAYVYIRVTLHWTCTEVVVHHGAISIVS